MRAFCTSGREASGSVSMSNRLLNRSDVSGVDSGRTNNSGRRPVATEGYGAEGLEDDEPSDGNNIDEGLDIETNSKYRATANY